MKSHLIRCERKPVTAEAIQLVNDEDVISALKEFCGDCIEIHQVSRGVTATVHTTEGPVVMIEGDYIVKDVNGELRSCSSDFFEKTYEVLPS